MGKGLSERNERMSFVIVNVVVVHRLTRLNFVLIESKVASGWRVGPLISLLVKLKVDVPQNESAIEHMIFRVKCRG